jgi:hypothetical protein
LIHEGLAVYPIYDDGGAASAAWSDVLTLEEGLAAGTTSVREVDERGSVRVVLVENRGAAPLFLLAGEIVLGGKQDRVVAADVVVPAGATSRVDVFCVERGRWAAARERARAAAAPPPSAEASATFVGTTSSLADSKLRRVASTSSDQLAVWAEVAKKASALRGESPTGTYRAAVEENAGVRPRVEAALEAIEGGLSARGAAGEGAPVGVAVAIDGKVEAADVFASPTLFAKIRKKVIRSHAVQAIASRAGSSPASPVPPGAPAPAPAPTVADVAALLAEATHAPASPDPRGPASEPGSVRRERLAGSRFEGTRTVETGTGRRVHEALFSR